MPRMIAAALAADSAPVAAEIVWLASASAESMATTDGIHSLYTSALLRVLRERDPSTYEEAQAAVGEVLVAAAQEVPAIAYRGARSDRWGRPFTP